MPVLRSTRTYRHKGRKRYIRLYRAWENMHRRVNGTTAAGNGSNLWLGLYVEPAWTDFEPFRAWALAHGYSAVNCSLDRYPTPARGYRADNCRWVTRSLNTHFQNACRAQGDPWEMGGCTRPSGEDCPF